MNNDGLLWVSSEGGPLLLLSRQHLREWEGTDVPSGDRVVEATFRWDGPGSPATDYDRACDVDDTIGVIPVGAGQAVVLGDEPAATAWYSRPAGDVSDSGILVRWIYADSEDVVVAALDQLAAVSWEDTGLRYTVDHSPLVLFDSAQNPARDDFEGSHEISLPPGTYRIETAFHKPDAETFLILHRFVV